ncbi:MAG: YbaK/EbsC family protein [Christensenellales bacterium]
MPDERVIKFFETIGKAKDVLDFEVSSATVELAAKAVGVIPARIAKTLSFYKDDGGILIVTAGDVKIDNAKFKKQFGCKAKMLSPDDVTRLTGYEVGGVCPFAIENSEIKSYCDISMKRFETVFPACGSHHSAIELTCADLFRLSNSMAWVDVCSMPVIQGE